MEQYQIVNFKKKSLGTSKHGSNQPRYYILARYYYLIFTKLF